MKRGWRSPALDFLEGDFLFSSVELMVLEIYAVAYGD